MDTRPKSGELIEATVEEVAAWLSATEGRAVSIHEVRRQAIRKIKTGYETGYGMNMENKEACSCKPCSLKLRFNV